MSDRSFFHAYQRIQQAHRALHRTLRSMEEDLSTADIIKRLDAAETLIEQAKARLSRDNN